MKSEFLEHLHYYFDRTYFTSAILLGSISIAFIFALRQLKNQLSARFFMPYIISGILLFSLSPIISYVKRDNSAEKFLLIETLNLIFLITEILTFINFFRIFLKKTLFLFLYPITLIFILISITLFVNYSIFNFDTTKLNSLSSQIVFLELTIIGLLCVSYFFRLLKSPSYSDLFAIPSFWIATSLIFYALIIPPFFIIQRTVFNANKSIYFDFYSLHYISLSMVYASITNSILCKKQLTAF